MYNVEMLKCLVFAIKLHITADECSATDIFLFVVLNVLFCNLYLI